MIATTPGKLALKASLTFTAFAVLLASAARGQAPTLDLPGISTVAEGFQFESPIDSQLRNPQAKNRFVAQQSDRRNATAAEPLQFLTPALLPTETLPTPSAAVAVTESVAAVHEPSTNDELPKPWWLAKDPSFTGTELHGAPWDLENLVWLAIQHSPYVQSVLIEPQIERSRVAATLGTFDPTTFVESIFNDTSDPVGNQLITGTADRLNEHLWENRSGVRKTNVHGGQGELSQEFLFKDNNSDFFFPRNQSDTKMVLRYTQPLMRGAGKTYNRASFAVASFRADESQYEAVADLQQHVLSITNSYWTLYASRAKLYQIRRGLQNLKKLREQLQQRTDIDSLRSQLLRADQAIAKQEASLARARAEILSSEAALRAAVAAPQLRDANRQAILTATQPADYRTVVSREHELNSALQNHPEVQSLQATLRAARVKLHVAEHELRPTLDLVLEAYVRGLNGDFDATRSFGDQFSKGAPSYSAGLSFTRPYRQDAAKAILRERRLELRRTLLDLDHTLLTVSSQVESAIARVDAAFVTLQSAVQATLTTHHELEYLRARLRNAFLDATSTSILLDQVLAAEIRLIESENIWAQSQADHMLSLANLRFESGSLLTSGSSIPSL